MSELIKRTITSICLVATLYAALMYKEILFFFIVLISFFVFREFFNLITKILYNKKKIVLSCSILIVYLSIFLPQLYLFIIYDNNNKLFFIYLLTICICTDLGGYICGNLFKGKKLSKISPKKTYSGLIGSYIFSTFVFIFFYYQYNFSAYFLILTILISTISQSGDLFISYLKRKAKIKDTGNILPGHGGILDRIDGIIFALPLGINLLFLFR